MTTVEIDRTGRGGDVITTPRQVPSHVADNLMSKWKKWDMAGPDSGVDPQFNTTYENEDGDEVELEINFRKALDIRQKP